MSFEKDNGSHESLLSSEQASEDVEWTPLNRRRNWRNYTYVGLNILLFCCSLFFFLAPTFGISLESEMERLRRTSFYCKWRSFWIPESSFFLSEANSQVQLLYSTRSNSR